MWPFFARKKHQQNVINIPPFHDQSGKSKPTPTSPMRFTQLVTGMGDFGDFRNHDTALKFWLPEAANEALEEMAGRSGLAMSELLRQLFATHCYGIYSYQVIVETMPGVLKTRSLRYSDASQIKYPSKKNGLILIGCPN